MRLDLDTEIRYPIGERVGVLRQVVLNETGQVQAVVMATDDLVSRNVIVPVELLSEEPGGVLTLNASPEDVDEMEDYNEQLVPMVPEGWQMSEDPAPGGEVFPDLYQPVIPVAEVPNLAEGLVNLSQGTEVWCLDGRLGIVDEVLINDDEQVYAFVARPDAVDEHDRIVPVALVQSVDNEVAMLNCTLADLPNYTQEIVTEHEEPEV